MVAVAAVVGGIGAFTDALTKIGKFIGVVQDSVSNQPLTANITISPIRTDGIETGAVAVEIRFANPPPQFGVKTITMHMSNMRVVPAGTHPSAKIQPVEVNAKIPGDVDDNDEYDLPVDVDMYNEKDQPYAFARLIISYANPGKQITFTARFGFKDVSGKPIEMMASPTTVDITVSHLNNVQYRQALGSREKK
ncbi:MAG TPA: hypothetical protein VHI52_03365 [Verrucomicrobiae bacterium]|nr:hypothetical protein [Verrucomicrobiae bacterium]